MTQLINLIPFRRLERRRQRTLRRWWFVGCAGYAVTVAVAAAAALTYDSRSGSGVQSRLAAVGVEVDRGSADVSQVTLELDQTSSVLRSSRAIAEQPDWSSLLALLAAKAGEDVTLKGCSVRPRQTSAVAAPRPAPGVAGASPAVAHDPTLIVNVLGLGSSQTAVSQFALRLEATRLFDRVTLLDTSREAFAGEQLVSFRIECTLAEPLKASPAGRPVAPRALTGGKQ